MGTPFVVSVRKPLPSGAATANEEPTVTASSGTLPAARTRESPVTPGMRSLLAGEPSIGTIVHPEAWYDPFQQ